MDKDTIRRIAERGRKRALDTIEQQREYDLFVQMDPFVDLFQHILDELESIPLDEDEKAINKFLELSERECPLCGGEADNGHDRGYPPVPYICTKCSPS